MLILGVIATVALSLRCNERYYFYSWGIVFVLSTAAMCTSFLRAGAFEPWVRGLFPQLPWYITDYLEDRESVLNLSPLGNSLTDARLKEALKNPLFSLLWVRVVFVNSKTVTGQALCVFFRPTYFQELKALSIWNNDMEIQPLVDQAEKRNITIELNGAPVLSANN